MAAGRDFPGATVMPDGRVLVAGGEGGEGAGVNVEKRVLPSAEVYTP